MAGSLSLVYWVCPEMHEVMKMAQICQSRQIHQTDFALMNLTKICQNHQFCDILL